MNNVTSQSNRYAIKWEEWGICPLPWFLPYSMNAALHFKAQVLIQWKLKCCNAVICFYMKFSPHSNIFFRFLLSTPFHPCCNTQIDNLSLKWRAPSGINIVIVRACMSIKLSWLLSQFSYLIDKHTLARTCLASGDNHINIPNRGVNKPTYHRTRCLQYRMACST